MAVEHVGAMVVVLKLLVEPHSSSGMASVTLLDHNIVVCKDSADNSGQTAFLVVVVAWQSHQHCPSA